MKISIFLIALFVSLTVNAAGFMAVANVVKIKGEALINREKIKEGDEIASGMTITLPKKGDFIDIKFQNGHIVRMMGATVKVEEVNPKTTLFNLIKGRIFSSVKKLTEGETYIVKTKKASFAVRGTRFFIDESKKESYLCVCEGIVNAKNSKKEFEVNKDQDLKISSNKTSKVTNASQIMIDMGNTTFKDMGVL